MSSVATGVKGEKLVHELLPGSVWVNAQGERHLPYDVIWNGVKIDVKTRTGTSKVDPSTCVFSLHFGVRYNGVVLVFLALTNNGNLLWVDKYRKGVVRTFKANTAVPETNLAEAIRAVATKEVTPFTEADEPAPIKYVTFNDTDYEFFKEIAAKMSEQEGIELRVAQALKKLAIRYGVENGMNK